MSGSTYTGSKSQVLRGSTFSIGALTGTTSETFTVIGEVTKYAFSGAKRTVLDSTNMQSGQIMEKLDAIADNGQVKVTYNRVSSDAGQVALIAAFNAGGKWDFTIQLPKTQAQTTTGDLYAFSAIISGGPEFDGEVNAIAQESATLDISGPITFTAGT
jgi:hypothetical protein